MKVSKIIRIIGLGYAKKVKSERKIFYEQDLFL